MILSFANQETEAIFHGTIPPEMPFPPAVLRITEERLDLLNGVDSYESLTRIPSLSAHIIQEGEKRYSIPLQDSWRLHFCWNREGPSEVAIKS